MKKTIGTNDGLERLGISWDVIGRIADGILTQRASKILTMIHSTRHDFSELEAVLQQELTAALYKNALLFLSFRAEQSISVLFRNLYERTADIGFLSQDSDIRAFVKNPSPSEEDTSRMKKRLFEYTQKYSVYRDVVVFDLDGNIKVRLSDTEKSIKTAEAFFSRTRNSSGYTESFGEFDFLTGNRNLVYSQGISGDDGEICGILALVFRFENEMEGIFKALGTVGMTFICISDADGRILAASDEDFLCPGKKIPIVHTSGGQEVSFMARRFFMVSYRGKPYQTYEGPEWYGHALIPMEYLHENNAEEIDESTLGNALTYIDVLCPTLRKILDSAESINAALRNVVWNGSIEATRNRDDAQQASLKAILGQIQQAGKETQQAFSSAIKRLTMLEVSSYLTTASDLARLGGNIMDRNLYERSDDCRFWALTSEIRYILSKEVISSDDLKRLNDILSEINSLYTVYPRLFIFNENGQVLAASNLHNDAIVLKGETLPDSWVEKTLALKNTGQYIVSPFVRTNLYDGHPTYVYAAAIRSMQNEDLVVGGMGIVFDSGPEFNRMLDDCLPDFPGAYALFVEKGSRRIVATSSNSGHRIGEVIAQSSEYFELSPGQSHEGLVNYRGKCNIVAAVESSGYREYKTTGDYENPIITLVILPIGDPPSENIGRECNVRYDTGSITTEPVHFATFVMGNQLFAIPAEHVCEVISAENLTKPMGGSEKIAGFIDYRDSTSGGSNLPQHLSVINGNELFRNPPACSTKGSHIIILRMEGMVFGLLVEAIDAVPTFDKSRVGDARLDITDDDYGYSYQAITPLEHGQAIILVLNAKALLCLITDKRSNVS